ncbi:MAG: agmatinase [Thaumarchaeota archaeon]|nr:agmatinase [Nitrososphaerota archaeon]
MRQIDFAKSPRFAQIATYGRLPFTKNLRGVKAVFVGIPFDGGVTYRSGARFGPGAIRQSSRLLRPYNYFTDTHPFDDLLACDYGDIDVVPGNVAKTMKMVEEGLAKVVLSAVPFIAGGDHSITLPVLRAMKRRHGKVNLVHMDSHFDFWDAHWGERFTHGSWLRRAREEGLLNEVIQLGIRGSFPSKGDLIDGKKLSITTFTTLDVIQRFDALKKALASLKGKTYLSLDIDVADPSFAPGTGTPEVGGLSSLDLIKLVRLMRLDLAGMDVVEVSPPYDVSELTSMLAANLLYEGMSVLSRRNG